MLLTTSSLSPASAAEIESANLKLQTNLAATQTLNIPVSNVKTLFSVASVNFKSIKIVDSTASFQADLVVKLAKKYVGKAPYVFTGDTPSGWDCSGFTRYIYKEAVGLELEHSANAQGEMGIRIKRDEAKKGDLVLFSNKSHGPGFYHVGIYDGKGKVYHAMNETEGTVHTDIDFSPNDKLVFVRILKNK